jgi:hypothetical protein
MIILLHNACQRGWLTCIFVIVLMLSEKRKYYDDGRYKGEFYHFG